MDPINYSLNVKSPFDSALSGVQAGIGISQAIDQSDARKQALAQQQQQMQQQRQMQGDLAVLSQKQNPTAQDFASITTKYPVLASHFKDTWSMLNQDQQAARLNQATQIFSALHAGQTGIASDLAQKSADAYKNSGNEQDAQSMDTLAKMIQMSPETAKTSTGLLLSSILGPEKFASTFSTLSKLPGEVAEGQAKAQKTQYEAQNTPERLSLENGQTAANVRNIDSQIGDRSGRLSLDRDKLQSEVQLKLYELGQKANTLDDGAKKLINDSTISAVAANQSAGQMGNLANRLESTGGGYGKFSSASEWLKQTTGSQDYMTQLRSEYARIRNGQVMQMLPPGSASDKDVEIAQKGFPPDTADAKTMASFLRGMAKLQQYSSAADTAKAEWTNAVGHLGKPKTDIMIDGIAVPAGSSFVDFTKNYLDKKQKQLATEQDQKNVGARGYMRWAQPEQGQ